jgi:hypothetical protein
LLNAAFAKEILYIFHHLLYPKKTVTPTVCGNLSDTSAKQFVGNTGDSNKLNLHTLYCVVIAVIGETEHKIVTAFRHSQQMFKQ